MGWYSLDGTSTMRCLPATDGPERSAASAEGFGRPVPHPPDTQLNRRPSSASLSCPPQKPKQNACRAQRSAAGWLADCDAVACSVTYHSCVHDARGNWSMQLRYAVPEDRDAIMALIDSVYGEYGDRLFPAGADRDLLDIAG